MANCGQIVVAMVGMLLVLCICAIVHLHKIEEAQVWLRFPMLLIMLGQIDKLGGLIYTETGKQTAYQYLCCQYKCYQCFHYQLTCIICLNVKFIIKFGATNKVRLFRNRPLLQKS